MISAPAAYQQRVVTDGIAIIIVMLAGSVNARSIGAVVVQFSSRPAELYAATHFACSVHDATGY